MTLNKRHFITAALATAALLAAPAWAAEEDYAGTIANFKKAEVSSKFFKNAYGYAVFPTIGKGGVIIGGAFGRGRVYEKGRHIGDTSVAQVSVGAQLGGAGYSQIIFFENAAALKAFTQGEFEFGAEASAVAVTLAATAKAGTTGAAAGASVDPGKGKVVGVYNNGMATFTLVKGGAMYEAALAGQKYKYTPKAPAKAASKA